MHYLRDLTVLILGLGDSGLAMARWCAYCGATVRVADSRAEPPQAATLAADVPLAQRHQGFDPAWLDGVNLVLKSPGLAPSAPELAALLAVAEERGIPVRGELSLFATALADLKADRRYAPKVLAITGTNGKTTTTSLTAQLVERVGLRVGMAGNIGPTLLDTLRVALLAEPTQAPKAPASEEPAEPPEPAHLAQPPVDLAEDGALIEPELLPDDPEAPLLVLAPPAPAEPVFEVLPEVWVLELSSFQLDGVNHFEPSAAVVLNLSQDHLDWHGSMAAYAQAKACIYGKTATMVINRDDSQVAAMVPLPEVIKSEVRGRPAQVRHRRVVSFGLNAPQRPGDFGLVVEAGMAWLVRARETDPTLKLKKGEVDEITLQRLMPADALRIRGRHNAANALAALALATAIGLPLAPMLHGLREYRGEPHRVEWVASVAGVDAIDDSKGTNVGATVAALVGLGEDLAPGKLVVILGGDGKGQDFAPLREPIARFARAVALIGRDAPALAAMLTPPSDSAESTGHPEVATPVLALAHHATLEAATQWAFTQARTGDAVLLSPACASLDMFRNYAHRAQVFVDTVREIAAEQGEIA